MAPPEGHSAITESMNFPVFSGTRPEQGIKSVHQGSFPPDQGRPNVRTNPPKTNDLTSPFARSEAARQV
jgi:hypothetical protein